MECLSSTRSLGGVPHGVACAMRATVNRRKNCGVGPRTCCRATSSTRTPGWKQGNAISHGRALLRAALCYRRRAAGSAVRESGHLGRKCSTDGAAGVPQGHNLHATLRKAKGDRNNAMYAAGTHNWLCQLDGLRDPHWLAPMRRHRCEGSGSVQRR